MYEVDWPAVDKVDFDQDAIVWWEGPSRRFTKLSSAVRCVVEEISEKSDIPAGITIFESPYFLEVEHIEYLYKRVLTTEDRADSSEQDAAIVGSVNDSSSFRAARETPQPPPDESPEIEPPPDQESPDVEPPPDVKPPPDEPFNPGARPT